MFVYSPADATNPIISCRILIQTGFTLLVYQLTHVVFEKRPLNGVVIKGIQEVKLRSVKIVHFLSGVVD